MTPMDPAIKQRWLTALLSGFYTQCKYLLRSPDTKKHCCLGVLCEELEPDGWCPSRPRLEGPAPDDGCFHSNWNGNSGGIAANAGLAQATILELIHMNDGGRSFQEIADWIEANL